MISRQTSVGLAAPLERQQRVFRTRAFHFEGGTILPELRIAYSTVGHLNQMRDNAIFLCHGASAGRDWATPFCGAGRAFDASRWFVISADMPGGGGSSRASTDPDFPRLYSIADLSAATALLLDDIGVGSVRTFCGSSMGGLVGLDLAYQRPDLVRGLSLWVTSYRSDGYARAMTESLVGILKLNGGDAGLRAAVGAFLPVIAGRQMIADMSSQALAALADDVARVWSTNWTAEELIARYTATGECDLALRHGGLQSLAQGVSCPTAFLQSSSDMIYPPADVQTLASLMSHAHVEVLSTPRGHIATVAAPESAEFAFFNDRTAAFLDSLRA